MPPSLINLLRNLVPSRSNGISTGPSGSGQQRRNGLYVEFIGPPGVGKSTIYNELTGAAGDLMKLSVLKRELNLPPQRLGNEHDELYGTLAGQMLHAIAMKDYAPMDKMRVLGYFHRVIEDDKLAVLHNPGRIVVSDEGLFHNFRSSIEHEMSKGPMSRDFCSMRAIVSIRSHPRTIAERILKRRLETGDMLPQHKGKDLDRLAMDQEEVCGQYMRFRDTLEQAGIPVLDIDGSADLRENVNAIRGFITSITTSKQDQAGPSFPPPRKRP